MDAEEAELLSPIRAQLERSRSKIADLQRAENKLTAALALDAPDDFEREARPARAGAARVAADVLAEQRSARVAQPEFASQGLLQSVRLVSSAAGLLALLPDAVRATADAVALEGADSREAAAHAHGARTRTEAEEAAAAMGKWRRRAAPQVPDDRFTSAERAAQPARARFPPIPLVPRKLALPTSQPTAAAAAAAHHTAAAAVAAAAIYEGGAASSHGVSHSPLLDAFEHYRQLSLGLPEPPEPPATTARQDVIQTPPAVQLRSEAQASLALHELRAVSSKLDSLCHEWHRAQHGQPALRSAQGGGEEPHRALGGYEPAPSAHPPSGPFSRGQKFASDAEVEAGDGSRGRAASPTARAGSGDWRESMGEPRRDDFSSPAGVPAMRGADAYADVLLRKLRALEDAVASNDM